MSLFEDPNYAYRDTFFVLFQKANRPSSKQILDALSELGDRFEIVNTQITDGILESVTIRSPHDYSAMDVAYVEGEEVSTQVKGLLEEFRAITLVGDDAKRVKQIANCDARFDVFHFEQMTTTGDEDQQLDPGGLLLVIEKLSTLSQGIGLDPQSLSLM